MSNDRLKKVKINKDPQYLKAANSSNSMSSKYSGVSSFKPFYHDQQLLHQKKLFSQGPRQEGDPESEGEHGSDSKFERQYGYDPKARIKRAWTLK